MSSEIPNRHVKYMSIDGLAINTSRLYFRYSLDQYIASKRNNILNVDDKNIIRKLDAPVTAVHEISLYELTIAKPSHLTHVYFNK